MPIKSRCHFAGTIVAFFVCICAVVSGAAHAQESKIIIDDFENDATRWTFNDNTRNNRPNVAATLVNATNVAPGAPNVADSKKAGLFTFKSATNAWADANIRVSGKEWKEKGAQRISFYLSAGGNRQGINIQLRRLVSGKNDELFKLSKPIRLDQQNWRKVVIPLEDFKSDKGNARDRADGIYLLQLSMRGSWDTRFFNIDQLQVEGTGKPAAAKEKEKGDDTETAREAATAKTDENVTTVEVDYLNSIGRIRSTADATIGAAGKSDALSLVNNRDFRVAIRELKPSWIRLSVGGLSTMTDSSRPSFDFSGLKAAAKSAHSVGAKVLLTIDDRSDWGLDEKSYASFAVQASRAVNQEGIIATDFELATMTSGRDIGHVVEAYNAARSALQKRSGKYKIGGITSSSRDLSTLTVFLAAAEGLDFLTVQDIGQDDISLQSTSEQFSTASNMQRLSNIAQELDRSRWRSAKIYVVTNLQAQQGESAKTPLVQMTAAAWWSTYLVNVSRLADQIFHNDAANPQWGLLDSKVHAFPSYYAMWMWNTFVPSGSERVATKTGGEQRVTAMGLNSPTAHNLILANTSNSERTAKISIRGFPVLHKSRVWIYDDIEQQPYQKDLPNSPQQTIKLAPYAVAVVQFLEPSKNKKK